MKTWFTTSMAWLQVALIGLSAGGSLLMVSQAVRADGMQRRSVLVAQSDRWSYQVRRELLKAALAAGLGGYNLTHDPFISSLGRGGREDVTLSLRQGKSYAIIGVCDNDCQDVDLALFDDNGNLIASDLQRDDTPMVRVTPRWSARFTVRVRMSSCSNAPCRYGIGVFGR